jgi:hypothetical protein
VDAASMLWPKAHAEHPELDQRDFATAIDGFRRGCGGPQEGCDFLATRSDDQIRTDRPDFPKDP